MSRENDLAASYWLWKSPFVIKAPLPLKTNVRGGGRSPSQVLLESFMNQKLFYALQYHSVKTKKMPVNHSCSHRSYLVITVGLLIRSVLFPPCSTVPEEVHLHFEPTLKDHAVPPADHNAGCPSYGWVSHLHACVSVLWHFLLYPAGPTSLPHSAVSLDKNNCPKRAYSLKIMCQQLQSYKPSQFKLIPKHVLKTFFNGVYGVTAIGCVCVFLYVRWINIFVIIKTA